MERATNTASRILLPCLAILLCAIVAGVVFAEDRKEDGKQPSPPKWQYLALTHDLSRDVTERELGKRITKLGQEGWELVSVENFSKSGTTSKTVFYFKRRL